MSEQRPYTTNPAEVLEQYVQRKLALVLAARQVRDAVDETERHRAELNEAAMSWEMRSFQESYGLAPEDDVEQP